MVSERSRARRRSQAERRRVDARPTNPPAIAEDADDLRAIRKAVDDAAAVSAALWFSYIFVLFYIAVSAGAVTHQDLLLESPVKLPFLSIDLPLLAFFALAPVLFVLSHAYTLVHFVLLGRKARRFHDELFRQFPSAGVDAETIERNRKTRDGLRQQLPSNVFVQFLAGPSGVRDGRFGWLLAAILWATLVVGPVLLLLLLQLQFLPYHHQGVTWVCRAALLVDIGLVWWLWPNVVGARDDQTTTRSWKRTGVAAALAVLAVVFSWGVAFFPGEPQERLATLAPTRVFTEANKILFSGKVDSATRRRRSPFSNTLVLPGFNIFEALKIENPEKIAWRAHAIDLRGRHLEGAVFDGATFGKADLTGAFLAGASFSQAQLQGASLDDAQLQGSILYAAQLQGASLDKAQLQGSSLFAAQLQGASLNEAKLQGASLAWAQFQGASLYMAQLQGAWLEAAQFQGAVLASAELQGAILQQAGLQGASLDGANLQGALLDDARLEGASLRNAELRGASLYRAAVWRMRWPEHITEFFAKELQWGFPVDAKLSDLRNENLRLTLELSFSFQMGFIYFDLQTIEDKILKQNIPIGILRDRALQRFAILHCDREHSALATCDNSINIPPDIVNIKAKIDANSNLIIDFGKLRQNIIGDLLCGVDENIVYIIKSGLNVYFYPGKLLSRDFWWEFENTPALVERILHCPVASKLSDDDKAALARIARDAPKAEAFTRK